MKAYTSFQTRATSQREAIPTRNDQVLNNAGGYVFAVDQWKRFEQFLIMGTEGGTFYVDQHKLTKDNAVNAIACIEADGRRAVDLIVHVSVAGLAAKNDPALFALALAASSACLATRGYALASLSKVARIPTHLFHFVTYVRQFRGMGRGLKRALGSWYLDREVDDLAYQVVKYQSRDGFSNRDVLRLTHPKTSDPSRNALFKWITDGAGSFEEREESVLELPMVVSAFEQAKDQGQSKYLPEHIRKFNLSREMLPTEALKRADVWEALLERMPPTALIRNLATMSKVGLLKPLSDATSLAVRKITDKEAFKRNRVHPIALLIALKQYASGKGLKGDGVWTPVPAICDALDAAFYDAFDNIEPTGKATMISVDMSGSMLGTAFPGWKNQPNRDIAGTNLHPVEAAAAIALAAAKRESNYYIMGFGSTFKEIGITPRMRLDQAVEVCRAKTFGMTDCAVPMTWALQNNVKVESSLVLTDNETYAGAIHPTQALTKYREKTGLATKQVWISMVPNGKTCADPRDPLQLDVIGFSADVVNVISNWLKA